MLLFCIMKRIGGSFFVLFLLILSFSFAIAVESEAGATVATDTSTTAIVEKSSTASSQTTTSSAATDVKTVTDTKTSTMTPSSSTTTTKSDVNTETKTEVKKETISTSAIPEEYKDEKLDRSTGLTPGSFFYFWEEYARAPFRSDDENAKQKIAEVKSAVESGDFKSAKKALEKYKGYASKIEKEADPEKKEKIQRDSAAIRNTIKEVEDKVPQVDRKELVEGVVKQAELNAKAVEVADKINTLCNELAKLDPAQYATICKLDKDAPEWRQKQDKKLTDSQKEDVKKFKDVMIQCMETQGKNCKCDDINVKDFSLRCKIVAPLADACQNKKDQSACEKMDDATRGMEDLLPEYLQDTFAEVQEEMSKEQFGRFMPEECVKAGAKTPEECAPIMIRTHAPEECKAELNKQKITNERDARKLCEEIMFKQNAPKECMDAGVKDHKECGKLMFVQKAPQECKDAGLTGENPSDSRKCQEIMQSKGGQGKPGQGFAFGKSCSDVKDKEERLKCFDEMSNHVQDAGKEFSGQFGSDNFGSFNGDFKSGGSFGGSNQGGGNWPNECTKVGATTKETCEKIMMQGRQDQFKKQKDYEENFAKECMNKGGRWDCGFSSIDRSNPCRCFNDDQQRQQPDQFKNNQQFNQVGQPGNFPEQCRQANALTAESCRKVMDQQGQQQREQGDQMRKENEQRMREQQDQFKQQPDQFRNQQPPGQSFCPPGQVCPPQGQMPPSGQQFQQPPAGTQPPQQQPPQGQFQQPPAGTQTQTSPPPSSSPPPSEPASSTSPPPVTGGVITGNVVGDNGFLKYYFR